MTICWYPEGGHLIEAQLYLQAAQLKNSIPYVKLTQSKAPQMDK